MLLRTDFPYAFSEAEKYLQQYGVAYEFSLESGLYEQDGFALTYRARKLSVQGVNKRSLLYGLYAFLRHLGYDWLYPGSEGEIQPTDCSRILDEDFIMHQCATQKYRGIVLEGANSLEHLMALFEWLPKLYYNSYFIQFFSPFYFFRNWYEHVHNPLWEKEGFSKEQAIAYRAICMDELKKRDLLIHDVGHGWTGKVLGIEASGWDQVDCAELEKLEEANKNYLAMLEGKRQFFGGIPSNTNLCYSSKEVQEKFSSAVVEYAIENPDSDYIHVWLADEYNNVCECDACTKKQLSDWYVAILNLIDKKLRQEGLPTKIVFLLYNDLLWPPREERIENPDRFVMMFAPITRSFDSPLEDGLTVGMREYLYNQVTLPLTTSENLAYLAGWQAAFAGDCFDFDYHLGRAHYGDFSYLKISRILAKDIGSLSAFGLKGMLMCQENRAFFPTSLPNYLAGLLLWDSSLDTETIIEEYYGKRFVDSEAALAFSDEISDLVSMDFWNAKYGIPAPQFVGNFIKIKEISENYLRMNSTDPLALDFFTYVKLFSSAMLVLAKEGRNSGIEWESLISFIRNYEKAHPMMLDSFRILDLMKRFFKVEV